MIRYLRLSETKANTKIALFPSRPTHPRSKSVIVAFLRKRNFLFPLRRATYGLLKSLFTTHLANILLTCFVFISSITLSLHLHIGQKWIHGVVSLWWDLLVAVGFSQAFSFLISIRNSRTILRASFAINYVAKSLPKAFRKTLTGLSDSEGAWIRRSASIMIRASVVRDEREIPSLFISSGDVFFFCNWYREESKIMLHLEPSTCRAMKKETKLGV